MSKSRRAGVASLACLLVAGLTACGAAPRMEITESRKVTEPTVRAEADSAYRFSGRSSGPVDHSGHDHANGGEPDLPFDWEVPPGWTTASPTELRIINLVPGGSPGAECYLTVLPGSAGGLEANVNRWRAQFGLEAQTEAEIAALPSVGLLGQPATFVELRGAYGGMGGEATAETSDYGLLGAIQVINGFTAFVKMTGPASVIEAERGGFERFCASLRPVAGEPAPAPVSAAPVPSGEGLPPAAGSSNDFAFTLPTGWSDAGARSMRAVNLAFGSSGQCYVIRLGGDAGGLLPNLNRWYGEVGMDPIDSAGLAKLETVELLGTVVPLFEGRGSYQGMGGPGGEDMQVLGVALIRDTTSLFIKLVAPASEAEGERANFLAFLASLEEIR